MLTLMKQYTILTLKKQGETNAEIARTLKCNRHTVENILLRGVKEKQTRHKPSAVAPYKTQIKEWQGKDYTLQRMHEMLTDNYGATFSYDALRKYVKKYLPRPKEAFGPQEHLPGQALQFDFGTSRVYFTDEKR